MTDDQITAALDQRRPARAAHPADAREAKFHYATLTGCSLT
jgi:hypothetical protein